ncbi:FISUMP domain-containing protein [Prevotella sp. 10(H)]|uniref:FISUMP domain-containing protein n=1 Tax=Prevotella sp. 10(H) TaxID=1158294 RepID=UPI0004A6F7BE|nr:FISUMP domain-containing protein [Prevotella sp. 10(H)]
MKQRSLRIAAGVFLFLIYIISINNASAQVTIGADMEPNKGSLLDLKQYAPTADNTNAVRGLSMPRVIINNLTPSTDAELAASIGTPGDNFEINTHIGLVVYNVGKEITDPCDDSTPIPPGLYVWHGDRWELLHDGNDRTMVFTDQEGKEFKARRFGSAGVWMIQNLAVKSYASNIASPPVLNIHTGGINPANAEYAYPSNTLSASQPAAWARKQGMLYSWAAATGKYTPTATDQIQSTASGVAPGNDEVESDSNIGTKDSKGNYIIQGICPEGWHLPSDREWNALEKELYNNASLYSSYNDTDMSGFIPSSPVTGWESIWETATFPDRNSLRGSGSDKGHGLAMIGRCMMPGAPTPLYTGKSLTAIEGGFDIIITGSIYNGSVHNYGETTQLWTSSASGAGNAYTRLFEYNISGGYQSPSNTYSVRVRRHSPERSYLHPVRCKQND